MKKLLVLLFAMTLCLSASAQLTAQQICKKSVAALDVNKGFKCKMAMKMAGIGETVDFYYYNKKCRMSSGDDIEFINNKITYDVEKKAKTVTLSVDDMSQMIMMPYAMVKALADADATKSPGIKKMKVSQKNNAYEISFEKDGTKMILEFDSKFYVKALKIKKSFITVISISYSNYAAFHDEKIVTYNKDDYPGYKIIDERKKNTSKKK